MPMSRYEIRNEYSLADPELYRAADKNDPEALLEGVAMAGLVGVLRQLGDVAEFAAEIFNDLHEEVLATASRGHGLMVRVQQLEAEVPSIEKAFIAQTDHSSFFNNAGVDWHPKQRMDQNLVTQDGLPRFVMDSYEECRGPPRLFLLDKFDVAGAGSCLKRYTDPSFFKVETSAMTNADGHREKKNRKAKKRGPRWRNKETSEVQPMSHAKFYQHLLEEPIENGVNKPARRAKLKKRLHFSPFDSKSGGSYMAELLKYPSPEHEMFGEISMSSPLRLSTNDLHESDLEFLEPGEDSLVGDCAEIKRSLSPDENMHIETVEKDIPVDGESNTEGYVTGYQSDEVASEIDNFVDAPSTIESGMDTDSEMRVKNDFASPSTNNQQSGSVDNEEHIHSLTSDSHSTGDLTISDDANSSSKKEMSSFLSSESPETSADNRHSRKMSAEGISSADIPEIATVDASSYQKTATSDDEEKKINLIMDHPRSSRVSDSNSQSGNDSRSSTAGEHVVEEPNCENGSRTSTVCHSKDSSAEMSDNMLHQDDYDHKDLNNLNNCSVLFQNRDDNAEMIPTENSVSGGLDDDVLKMTEKGLSNYTDIVHSGDDITSKLTRDEKLKDKLDNEDSDVFSDVSNHSSCIMEASLGKEPVETSFAEAIDAKELCSNSSIENQVISKTLISSPKEDSPDLVEAGLGTHDGVSIPENETTVNQTPELGNPESCEVVGVEGTGITYVEEPNDFVALESSSCTPENLENHAEMSGFAAYDKVGPDKDAIGREVTETSSYEDRKSPNEAHEPLDESVSKTDRTETGAMASSLAVTVSDIDVGENVSLHVGLDNLVKEHISCFDDSGLNENEKSLSECHQESGLVEEDNSYLSESHTKSGLVDEVNVGEGSTSEDLRTVSCSTVDKDLPKLNVLHTVPDSYIDSAVEATEVWSPLEQCGNLDADEESFQKSGIEYQISDATSLPINCETEEAMLEKTELPPAQVDQESTFLLPINHQQILNHDEDHHENPASSPELQELRNNGIDISKYPKDDPSGFMFLPSNNPFSETNNHIDLDELPPLPPLPPVQWRMGKNHNASSITTTMKEEVTKQNDFFPQESNISFSLEHTKPEEEKIKTIDIPLKIENEQQQQIVMPTPENEVTSPAAEIETIDFPLKIENEQQQQIVMPTPENEVTSPAAEIETIDFPLKIENEQQQQIVMSTPENEVTSPAAEIERIDLPLKIGNEQQQQTVMPTPENEVTSPEAEIETIDFPLKIENEQQQQIVMPTPENEVTSPAAEIETIDFPLKIENEQQQQIVMPSPDNEVTSPAAEIETIDFPLKIENEQQQQIVMPTPENEVTPPAAEVNGIVNETRTVKLPRPPNPLIESIDVLDKSKLRKASERVRPQLQKVEERDSLLEQIRAKSFNLKPAVSSKPSITGPQTNLNIAAILERANAIRQAFAGSDEDDEDNWSDS